MQKEKSGNAEGFEKGNPQLASWRRVTLSTWLNCLLPIHNSDMALFVNRGTAMQTKAQYEWCLIWRERGSPGTQRQRHGSPPCDPGVVWDEHAI